MDYDEINMYIPEDNFRIFPTPLGDILAVADENKLIALQYMDYTYLKPLLNKIQRQLKSSSDGSQVLMRTITELKEYFAGERKIFTIPLGFTGTDFQQKVWKTLLSIPYGSTISYQEQAITLKQPGAARAAGSANGKNPIIILIPCHRVVKKQAGSQINIGGFSNGPERKKRLLELEGVL